MSEPTTGQIYADVTRPEFLVEWKPSGSWVALGASDMSDILNVSGAMDADSGGGVGFGSFASSAFGVETVDDPAISSVTPDFVPMRASVGYDGSAKMPMCAGVTLSRRRSRAGASLGFEVQGWHAAIQRQPIYSPLFYRRRGFTATTALSVEDPTSPAYQGGLGNYILWKVGGRPLEQPLTHGGGSFTYSCKTSLLTIPWAWAAGSNSWEELLRLTRATGGQLYQAPDGTITYRTPLDFAEPVGAPFTFTPDIYLDMQEDRPLSEVMHKVECSYLERTVGPLQEVYKDTTTRELAASGTLTLAIVPTWPLYRHGAVELHAVDGQAGQQITLPFTVDDDQAQRITITITNPVTRPVVITQLRLQGVPVAAGEEATLIYDTGFSGPLTTTFTVEKNIFIQERSHAQPLSQMIGQFAGLPRPQRTLSGCPFDPRRRLGEYVLLTDSAWSLSAAPHRITAIRHSETGAQSDYTLVDVLGLPKRSDMFVIGQAYAGGTSRQLSY